MADVLSSDLFKMSFSGYSDTSFLATFDTSPVTPTNPIVFNYAVLNPGNQYNSTTGIYTVPLDGTYEIIFQFQSYNDNMAPAFLVVDGVRVSIGHAVICPLALKFSNVKGTVPSRTQFFHFDIHFH